MRPSHTCIYSWELRRGRSRIAQPRTSQGTIGTHTRTGRWHEREGPTPARAPDPGLRFEKASLLSGSWSHPEGTVMGGHSHCPFPGKTWILIRDIPCCPLETQPVVTSIPRGPAVSQAVLSLLPPAPCLPLLWGTQTLRQRRLSPQPALCPEPVSGPTWNLDDWPGAQPHGESPVLSGCPECPPLCVVAVSPRALPSLPPSPSFVSPPSSSCLSCFAFTFLYSDKKTRNKPGSQVPQCGVQSAACGVGQPLSQSRGCPAQLPPAMATRWQWCGILAGTWLSQERGGGAGAEAGLPPVLHLDTPHR